MKDPVVIIGFGEMAGVFARGFLRLGYPVYPITRDMNIHHEAKNLLNPALVILAVGENDLDVALETLPDHWREQLLLLQNELLPRNWMKYRLNPTVISVWFEKKKGQDYKVLIPSPVFGPQSQLVADALAAIDIPAEVLDSAAELEDQLLIKNVYILTTNIAGLEVGGTVSELWSKHEQLARDVANDVIALQTTMVPREKLDSEKLIQGMLVAFEGDPQHNCMGRSAPGRLARAAKTAKMACVEVPHLDRIQSQQS